MAQNTNGQFQNSPHRQSAAQMYNQAFIQPPKKKNSFTLVLICLLLVLALCIGDITLVFVYLSKKKKAASNFNVLDSSISQLSLGTDDNGDFRILSGSFEDKISSEDDALEFISKHSNEIGIKDASKELEFMSERTYKGVTYYRFKQALNGVPVYGNELIVTVTPDGKAYSVNGTYSPLKISTTPSKTLEEAETAAKENLGEGAKVLSSELTVIPRNEKGKAKLVYDIKATGESDSSEQIIDSNNCKVINEFPLYSALTESVNVFVNGKILSAELEKEGSDTYIYNDPNRDIMVSDGSLYSGVTVAVTHGLFGGCIPISANKLFDNDDGSVCLESVAYGSGNVGQTLTEYSVGSLGSVQNAYDYYDQKLGWKSFDGNCMPLKIIVEVKAPLVSTNNPTDNLLDILKDLGWFVPAFDTYLGAGYASGTNIIMIGAIDHEPCYGKGILGHEYTHAVIHNIAGLKADTYPATVNEGYADVMGSIISNDWEFFPDEAPKTWERYDTCCRSAIDPNKYHGPSEVGGEYFVPFVSTGKDGKTKYADEHDNATIISHSAYLMTQKGLSNDEVAEVFFNSMFMLESDADFEQAGIALILSAELLSYSQEKVKAVREALYETKIYAPNEKTYIYVHNGKKSIKNASVTINGKYVGKTDKHGNLVLDFNTDWFGEDVIRANAEGYDSLAKNVSMYGEMQKLDFDLSPKDPNKKEGTVKVTILDMTDPESMDKAEVFYVEKGSTIDLNDFVGKIGGIGISTDGTKLYFANGYVPVELFYRIHGTDEIFDFSKPITEDVTIEPVIGIDGEGYSFQDFMDIKESFEELFGTTESGSGGVG